MRCVILVPGLVLALAPPLRAVAQPPCSANVEQSAIAKRLCREVLPSNYTVLMKDGNGGLCSCRCTELELMPYKQVMDLKAARDSANASNLRRYAQTRKPMVYSNTASPYVVALDEDTVPNTDMSGLCVYDVMLVRTMQRIAERGVVDLDGFELGLLAAIDAGDNYPVMSPGRPGGGVEGMLTVPRRFVVDPAVRWELMLFMLLHELGHGVNYEQDGKYVSEYEADMWAVNVGLPLFFTNENDDDHEDDPAEVLAIRLAAADQLHNYFISVHTSAAEQYSSVRDETAIGYPMNVYPMLQCRLDSIRYGVLLEEQPDDPYLGYPGSCWENPHASFPQNGKLAWQKLCDDQRRKKTPCEKYPGACEVQAEVDTLMQEWNKLLDKCAQRPDLCFRGGKVTVLNQLSAKGRMNHVDMQRQQLLKDIRRARATAVRTERELQGGKK
ncbi:MAG: hypothetical protein IPO17_17555 [Flavobacteriales bacterium]|nr:hypothetical protein [Flavobacteriales bacterium]